jgi:TonB family protein
MDQRSSDEQSFLRRHGVAAVAGVAAVVVIVGLAFLMGGDDKPPTRKVNELQIVNIEPPPPPPPPPEPPPEPIQQEQPEPEMIEQPEIEQPEVKPEDPPEEMPPSEADSNDAPPGDLGLDAVGEGPGDSFNLVGNPGGTGLFGGGAGGGSRWGKYAAMMQAELEAALRKNKKINTSQMNGVLVRVWVDQTGRITRGRITKSTGNPELDAEIEGTIVGVVFSTTLPRDMPMPVKVRFDGRRPT